LLGVTILEVELGIILTIVALFVIGALTPRMETRPWQGGFVLFADTKEAIRIVYRIWATWRKERMGRNRSVLTQHFEVFQGADPQCETRKLL